MSSRVIRKTWKALGEKKSAFILVAQMIKDLSAVPETWVWFPGGEEPQPLQCSCLENPMDRGAWWATVYGVTKSQTCLIDYHSLFIGNQDSVPLLSNLSSAPCSPPCLQQSEVMTRRDTMGQEVESGLALKHSILRQRPRQEGEVATHAGKCSFCTSHRLRALKPSEWGQTSPAAVIPSHWFGSLDRGGKF